MKSVRSITNVELFITVGILVIGATFVGVGLRQLAAEHAAAISKLEDVPPGARESGQTLHVATAESRPERDPERPAD